jgi:hypothetical protein
MASSYAFPTDRMTIEHVRTFVRYLVWIIKNCTFILGAIGLVMVDIVTGPLFLGNLNTTGSPINSAMFWGFSLGLTVFQMVLWDKAPDFSSTFDIRNFLTSLPVIGAGMLMIIDTLLDIGYVTQLLYPNNPTTTVFPPADGRTLVWWLLTIGIGTCSLFFEIMMVWILGNQRSSAPRIKQNSRGKPYDDDDFDGLGDPLMK